MCEPKVSAGLVDLACALLTSQAVRRVLAVAGVAVGLYVASQVSVTVPLLVPLAGSVWALAGTVASVVLYLRHRRCARARTLAPVRRMAVAAIEGPRRAVSTGPVAIEARRAGREAVIADDPVNAAREATR